MRKQCKFCNRVDGLVFEYHKTHFVHAFCGFRHVDYLKLTSYLPLKFEPSAQIIPTSKFYCSLCLSNEGILEKCSIKGCKIYEHAYCAAKKSRCPINLHSGFRCAHHLTHSVELEETSSFLYAELAHSLAGNSTSLMTLTHLDLTIIYEMRTLEQDKKITQARDLVTFYACLERLSRSATEKSVTGSKATRSLAEKLPTCTKVFDDFLIGKLLESFKIFKKSPYVSQDTIQNMAKLANERKNWL
jgi:hypothetical protein